MNGAKLGLFVLLAISACRTPQRSGPKYELKENPHGQLKLDDDQRELPEEMWSPLSRQSSGSFYYMKAEYLAMEGKIAEAAALFEDAYNLDPNPFLGFKVIAAQANSGQTEEALLAAKKMVLTYPKNAELHVLYGQLLARNSLFEAAIKHFETSIDLNPDGLEGYLGLIQVYQVTQKPSEAIAVAKDLVKSDPTYVEGWTLLAKLYLGQNQKRESLKAAARAYELSPSDPEKILVYAFTLELNGESKRSISLYESLYRLNPNNEELIGRMVDLYRELGDLQVALNLIDEGIKAQDKPSSNLLMQKVFILWELKRAEEADKILTQLAAEYQDSDRVQYMQGLGKEKIGKKVEAMAIYQKIDEGSPLKAHAYYRVVQILRDDKKYDEAFALCRKMLDQGGERGEEFYNVGASVLVDAGKTNEAITLIDEGIRKKPSNPQLWFMKGVYQEKTGKISDSIASMRKVIEIDPKHSGAHNFLGYLYAERGENLDEAETLIKRALELKPNDGYYLDSLGWVYFQKKNYQKALETLLKADRIVPGEGVILEHVSETYTALGNDKEALAFMERAAKGKTEPNEKARIEGKLAKLRAGQKK